MTNVQLSQLRTLALKAESLRPSNRVELALLGHFLGAVYALDKARALRVQDRTGNALPSGYREELRRVARAISKRRSLNQIPWLGDFYLNSALYRLSAVAERLPKHVGQDRRLIKDVTEDVNKMKHETEGLLAGRSVGFACCR